MRSPDNASNVVTAPSKPFPPVGLGCTSLEHASTLPLELLLIIFKPLRPQFQPDYQRGFTWDQRKEYFHALKHFADLRLMCTSWNRAIIPILYQDIVLFTAPFTHLQRCTTVFEHAADCIRSVIIQGSQNQSIMQDLVDELLEKCLLICNNLRILECYDSHYTFTSPKWLSTVVPHLASTVTHLSIETDDTDAISNSLVTLGPFLKTLQIRRYIWNIPNVFPLPPAFPRLSQMTVSYGPNARILEKVFARIVEVTPDNQKRSPLRKLSFVDLYSLKSSDFLSLLEINHIGSRLTSLSIKLYKYHYMSPAFPVEVIKACPMLEEFLYPLPTHKEIFNQLRSPIQHLNLLIDRTCSDPHIINSPDDFLPYIRNNAGHSLHTLAVVAKWSNHAGGRIDGIGLLKSACDDLGILLNYSRFDSCILN